MKDIIQGFIFEFLLILSLFLIHYTCSFNSPISYPSMCWQQCHNTLLSGPSRWTHFSAISHWYPDPTIMTVEEVEVPMTVDAPKKSFCLESEYKRRFAKSCISLRKDLTHPLSSLPFTQITLYKIPYFYHQLPSKSATN